MTSKQVMLIVAVLLISGCQWLQQGTEPLACPYEQRRVLAITPLVNESGNSSGDGLVLADHLARQLENVPNVDVLPVNRTLEVMDALGLHRVNSYTAAMQISQTLGVDGLIVGSIMGYDPYDPPKIALVIELYSNPSSERPVASLDIRQLRKTASGQSSVSKVSSLSGETGPVNIVSYFFDAADPHVRNALQRYAQGRGVDKIEYGWPRHLAGLSRSHETTVHLHRINMDLFSQFVCQQMSWKLMQAESQRLASRQVVHAGPSP